MHTTQDHPELLAPVDYQEIRAITSLMHNMISSGTTDSPSWDLVRTGKVAARIYAPLGTRMSLGDHVRLGRTFLEAFKASMKDLDGDAAGEDIDPNASTRRALHNDLKV